MTDVAAQVELATECKTTVYKMANGTVLDAERTLLRSDLDEMCDAVLALAAHIEKIERERDALQERLTIQNLPSVATEYASRRAEAAERERDDYKGSFWVERDACLAAERRVEALEAALREIKARDPYDLGYVQHVQLLAHRALNPEPYADIPGAGQRGC